MSTVITRRGFLCGVAFATRSHSAAGQPPARVPQIGYMSFGPVARGGWRDPTTGFCLVCVNWGTSRVKISSSSR
jgi:hypothetical protein